MISDSKANGGVPCNPNVEAILFLDLEQSSLTVISQGQFERLGANG